MLQALIQQLSTEGEQGLGRVIAIDSQVDRCLCAQVMRYIPPASQEVRNTLVMMLQSLNLIWNKQSTTQRRKDSRVRGLEILPSLLTWWTLPDLDLHESSTVLSILRSWTKMQDDTIKSLLVKAGLVQALSIPFTRQAEMDPKLWPACLGLVKDLIFRAKASEKEVLYGVWMQHVLLTLPMETCSEPATACLWNWAVDDDLALRMATNTRLWSTLVQCPPAFPNHGARRNALSAVGSILSVCVSKLDEAPFLSESHGAWIVSLAVQTLEDSEDHDLRRRAVRSIRCLSVASWGRIFLLNYFKSHQGVLNFLAKIFSDSEEQDDTRTQVSLAINNLLPHLHESWARVGPQLELSIVRVTADPRASIKIVKHSIQVLVTCFEFSPWKRGSGCLSDAFLVRLHLLLKENLSDSDFHELVVALFYQVAVKTSDSVFANPRVVDILALLLSDFPETTAKAVECIQTAVQASAAKKHFVGHDLLLTNLVNVCIASSGERKAKAKALLVSLVSDL